MTFLRFEISADLSLVLPGFTDDLHVQTQNVNEQIPLRNINEITKLRACQNYQNVVLNNSLYLLLY